jgi:3-methyl-2-oxobutanoate hydroxymethyltransferase
VTIDDMVYHTRCVVRGSQRALVVGDLSFGSYQQSPQQAFESAARLMAAGAGMVKLEGGLVMAETVNFLVQRGIPVMGHLGLTPQSIYKFGTYTVRAKEEAEAQKLREDALFLQNIGCFAIVLEKIPALLAKEVSESLEIPTIGIGAGRYTDGQVLVTHDMMGITKDFKPRFLRRYLELFDAMGDATRRYIADVKSNDFPSEQEQY